MELFEQIRKDRRVEGASIRELADRQRVHRCTVRQTLASAVPPSRWPFPQRPRPAIGAYADLIDGWLLGDQRMPRKQRHTARRIWQRLVTEHGAACRFRAASLKPASSGAGLLSIGSGPAARRSGSMRGTAGRSGGVSRTCRGRAGAGQGARSSAVTGRCF